MYKEIQSIRNRITDRIILIAVVFITPAYISSIARYLEIGWLDIYYIHTFLYLLIIGLLIYRKRISTEIKVYFLIFLFTFLGITALWYLGFSGVHYFVIVAIAIATVLSSRKVAYILIGVIAFFYLGIGIMYMLGYRNAVVELNSFSHSILQWSTITLSLIAFAAIFIDGLGELYNTLILSLREKSVVQKRLEEHNQELKETQVELAGKVEEINDINLKLQLSEEKYRTLINLSPDIIYWYSTKNGGLFFSDRTFEVLGYTPDELIEDPKLWPSVFHPEDVGSFQQKIKNLPLNERNTQEYRVKTKDGRWIWIEDTFFVFKHTANELIIQGHLADVTKQKMVEKELSESEQRWHFSVDGSNLGLWDWNLSTNKVFYSTQWKKMLGFAEHEINSKYSEWESRVHPEDLPGVLAKKNAYLKGDGVVYVSEHRMACSNGNYKWVLDRGKILSYTDDGLPARMIGTQSDITDQKLVELELRKSNATKDKFFSIIAHDLKSPFSSMMGLMEILNENFDDFDRKTQQKFVTGIYEGMTKTYALLEDLLLWSRAQRNTIDFYPLDIDFSVIIHEILGVLKFSADKKSITISTSVPENAKVYADKFMLSSILRNLISNAIKFTPVGGNITVSFELIENNNKKSARISVADTGVGIDAEDHLKIFDIGQNISRIGTANEKGTGMGLPICYEFVTQHGGNIWFESEPGKGSVFNFTLPQK